MLTIGLYGIPDPTGRMVTHDHGVALLRDGQWLTHIELERVSGRKHDNNLAEWLDRLVAPWIERDEPVRFAFVDSFAGRRFATRERTLVLEAPDDPPLVPGLLPCRVLRREGLWNRPIEAFTVRHELAHLGTLLPLYGAPPPATLLVHIDGGASVSASSVWLVESAGEPAPRVRLRLLEHRWDALKTVVNLFNDNPLSEAILGLSPREHLSMPGKLMGLSAHGRPEDRVMQWLDEHALFAEPHWRERDLLALAHRHFGAQRTDDPTRSPLAQSIAACMQRRFEDAVLAFLQRWLQRTAARRLWLSGGAALNILLGARCARELPVEQFAVPPAPSDTGLALGAAALSCWLLDGVLARLVDPYPTRLHPDAAPLGAPPTSSTDPRTVARWIADGRIVAVVLGAAELGPRALGHRSLLARPDDVALRRRLSEGLKQREWYRPVAPMMLPHTAREALEPAATRSPLGRYMLAAWRLRPRWRTALQGCVHVDGTVRAQILDPGLPAQQPLCELLEILEREHGIHAVINTSLNRRGVPILGSPRAAANEARRLGADALWQC